MSKNSTLEDHKKLIGIKDDNDEDSCYRMFGGIRMKDVPPEVFSNPVEWNCLGTMRSLIFTSGIMGFCSEKDYV